MFLRRLEAAAFACGCCLFSFAQASMAPTSMAEESPVVVTASRVEEPLENTLWSSTLITRADIEARQPASVLELLSDVAGVHVANNGGLGKLSSVFIRGGESEHTLLLVDGVRVASATAGTAAFEFIPVEQIERVEIVRGPRSTLYGTDAVGGVIQIFTRRAPSVAGVNFGASLGGGSHDTRRIGASLQARGERAWISLGAESFDTEGFNSCAREAASAFVACFADEPDADGYRNDSGSLGAGYTFNDRWSVQLRSLVADGETEYDGSVFSGNETEFSQRVFSVSLDGALNDAWKTRVTVGRSQDHQDNFFRDAPGIVQVGAFDTDRNTASAQLDGALTGQLRLIAGVEQQRDKVGGDTAYAVDSRRATGVFSELHGRFGAWSTLAGVRYEDNEQFGSHVTGNIGAGRALADNLRVTATWGTAFHAPTFNDLYHPFGSNPDLEPEESHSFELGIDGRLTGAPVDWSLHVFQNDIDRLISLDANFIPINISSARIRGAELQAHWRLDAWSIGGQVTRMNPVDRDSGNLLPRRSKETASVETRWSWGSGSAGTVARYQGRRFDNLANTRPLPGYVTIDLAATQAIGKAFEIQARVANLFDRDYQTATYYLQDGRNYSVTLRYAFAGGR